MSHHLPTMAHFVYPTVNTGQQGAYPPQTAYVAAAPQAAYATAAPRAAQAYDSYQAVNAAPQYAYATGARVAVSPAATYDQAKAYYQPAQAAVPASHYASADHYQVSRETVRVPVAIVSSAKPSYTPTASYTTHTQRQPPAPKAQPLQASSAPAAPSYVYNVTTTAAPTQSYASNYTKPITAPAAPAAYSSYDSALYSAATSYYQQQHKVGGGGGVASAGSANTGGGPSSVPPASSANAWAGFKKGNLFIRKPAPINKGPPKTAQIHYCDVCKISCAGPLTYKEHLEGQKHKKKEVAMKSTTPAPAAVNRGLHQIRCELCDVTCTGADAYAAHIRGAKHQKVLKLHQKLGKPIPQADPQLLTTAMAAATASGAGETGAKKPAGGLGTMITKKVTATPKINFVGGSTLKMLGDKAEEMMKVERDDDDDDDMDDMNMLGEAIVAPVGHEYIEEIHEPGKSVSFNCKLCECKFNDPNAKDMHMKGRRHRLQFKKRVDPTLQVDIKPSIRTRKIQEDKLRRQAQKEEQWRRRLEEERWRDEMRMEEQVYWSERRRYEEEMEYYEWQRQQGLTPPLPPRPLQRPRPPMQMRRPETIDDRHVMAKHHNIYPKENELQAVQNMVSACEKSLKLVSDHITETDGKKVDIVKKEKPADAAAAADKPVRLLKGVMRVGVLAKGLLLHGDLNVNLVVLCSEKPTRTLLERLADNLPKQLATLTDQKFEVKRCVEEAALIVTSEDELPTSCTITLTSPIMRETNVADGEAGSVSMKDPPDVLDRQKCLDALAALRHAKWFQAKANGLQSCVILIRILRDLCQRVPTWTPLTEWAMELLVEKCVSSGGNSMTPGDALRRVFECIASGILLPGGPGLYDPCEKDATEAASSLTNQQREEITASAQHALRLIAFRQIHKVLGMDPLPSPRFKARVFSKNLKRRHTNSQGEGEEGGEKKDKKDEGKDAMDTTPAGKV